MVYCRVLASILTAGAGMLIAGVGNVYTGVSATREHSTAFVWQSVRSVVFPSVIEESRDICTPLPYEYCTTTRIIQQ